MVEKGRLAIVAEEGVEGLDVGVDGGLEGGIGGAVGRGVSEKLLAADLVELDVPVLAGRLLLLGSHCVLVCEEDLGSCPGVQYLGICGLVFSRWI